MLAAVISPVQEIRGNLSGIIIALNKEFKPEDHVFSPRIAPEISLDDSSVENEKDSVLKRRKKRGAAECYYGS